jgi:hypothetical protein
VGSTKSSLIFVGGVGLQTRAGRPRPAPRTGRTAVRLIRPGRRIAGLEAHPTSCRRRPVSLLIFVFTIAAYAQDTRTVTEPAIPKTCAVVTAQLTAVDGNKTPADADEGKLDTARIQKALDTCPKGQAVELQPDGAHNAFLSGPLDLRAGVTLRIDAKATLFASNNAKLLRSVRVVAGSSTPLDAGWTSLRGMRNLLVGTRRTSPQGRQSKLPTPRGAGPVRQRHAVPDHAEELAELPRLLPLRQRIHRVGRDHRHAEDRSQHLRHRSRAREQRHDQGWRQVRSHGDFAQPLLHRPRYEHRQRDRWRRGHDSTTACASGAIPAEAAR